MGGLPVARQSFAPYRRGGSLTPISIRPLAESDLPLIAQIDRSEVIRVGYEAHDGRLVQIDVEWNVPDFLKDGDGEHTVAQQLAFCKRHVDGGAISLGAFDGYRLVAIGLLTPEIRPGLAQLAYLQVSSPYRRMGIASKITARLLALAQIKGARQVYVSATPSQSAVGFYRSFGFRVAPEPLPELYALEPDDIHMVLDLAARPVVPRT